MRHSLLKVLSISLPILLTACGYSQHNSPANTSQSGEATMQHAIPSEMPELDHIDVMQTASNTSYTLAAEQAPALFQHLSTAKYDTVWNQGDIMIKMVAPDYTLMLNNKGDKQNDVLMLWQESGKVKFRNVWFVLSADEMNSVIQMLNK